MIASITNAVMSTIPYMVEEDSSGAVVMFLLVMALSGIALSFRK